MQVLIGGQYEPVTITRKNVKRITLRIGKQGEILITCPRWTMLYEIEKLIYTNEAWILDQKLRRRKEAEVNREGISGDTIWWLGQPRRVSYESALRDSVTIDGDEIRFFLKEKTDARIEAAFRKVANKKLLELAEEARAAWDTQICDPKGIEHPVIKTRYMTSRWGVCYTTKHVITLSTRLIHYPEECFEYVLLHEYAHFLVPNHSAAFYSVIRRYMTDYRERIRLLK